MPKRRRGRPRIEEPLLGFNFKLEESLVNRWLDFVDAAQPRASQAQWLRLILKEFLDKQDKERGKKK